MSAVHVITVVKRRH